MRMDNIFRVPRVWSNRELEKFSTLFFGDIVNVSGWKDEDKEGKLYKEYFKNAKSYTMTNYKSEARGFQGGDNEIFLDLTNDLPNELKNKFDVVFNHTVLEHIYEVRKAFTNLCQMSKDVVILVVPFMQKMHADYGDYWRFTPETIRLMFEENDFHLLYLSFNSQKKSSVYIFAIASKKPKTWKDKIPYSYSYEDPIKIVESENFIGVHAIPPNKGLLKRVKHAIRTILKNEGRQ